MASKFKRFTSEETVLLKNHVRVLGPNKLKVPLSLKKSLRAASGVIRTKKCIYYKLWQLRKDMGTTATAIDLVPKAKRGRPATHQNNTPTSRRMRVPLTKLSITFEAGKMFMDLEP
jgi:hypothetical protein